MFLSSWLIKNNNEEELPSSPSHSLCPFVSSAQELSQEIKSFINGVDTVQGRKLSVREHARCAVRLLRSVPACRGAVLEHLRGVYDEHVSAFLHNLETDGDASSAVSSNLEDIIQVCTVLFKNLISIKHCTYVFFKLIFNHYLV